MAVALPIAIRRVRRALRPWPPGLYPATDRAQSGASGPDESTVCREAIEQHAACFRAAVRMDAKTLAQQHRHQLIALGTDCDFLARAVTSQIDSRFEPRLASILAFVDIFQTGDDRRIAAAGRALAAVGVSTVDLAALTRSLAEIAFFARFPSLTEEQ